ncbi:MAG: methylated-DNA--[protein]-cysteine S-methyltransferase, partial [Deltaproteobacteria bacterium]|nr:methylated-DNA--[protein]-cysteine S-methyltransferase [Deltaproteobacteria bacterium]
LAAQRARRALQGGGGVLEAALEAGLSGPSRLHDLLLTVERMTPGEYRAAARGVEIRHGVHDTAFGPALVAATPRGVCAVAFLEGSERAAVDELRARWPGATLREDRRAVKAVAEALSARMAGRAGQPLSVLLRGTPFQLQVWEALLRVPEGRTVTYGAVAEAVGAPRAVRAVGTAVGDNPLAWLIPCHRVIRASGVLGEYRWGAARKAAMLACEGAAGVRWR